MSIRQQAHGFADYSTIIVYLLVCACVWHGARDQKKLQLALVPNKKHNRFAVKTKQVCMNHQERHTSSHCAHATPILMSELFWYEVRSSWQKPYGLAEEICMMNGPSHLIKSVQLQLSSCDISISSGWSSIHAAPCTNCTANSRNCFHPASSAQLCVCACVCVCVCVWQREFVGTYMDA